MKKSLLLVAAAMFAFSASADFEDYYVQRSGATAQIIPQAAGQYIDLENSNVYIHPDNFPEDMSTLAQIVAPDANGKLDGMVQVGKNHEGDVIEFIVRSTQNELGYMFTFHYGTKNDYGYVTVEFLDADGFTLAEEEVDCPNVKEWNSEKAGQFGLGIVQLEKDILPINEDVTLRITFHKSDPEYVSDNVINMRYLHFEAKDPVEFYELHTYTDVVGDHPEDLASYGTITRNPAGTQYEEGTSVTLTASPAANYKFVYWVDDAVGEEVKTPSYTVVMDEEKDITAYFEYVDPNNVAPGMMDPFTNLGSAQTYNWFGQTGSDGKQRAVKVDDQLWPDENRSVEGFDWTGIKLGKGGKYARFNVNITIPGTYNIVLPLAQKNSEDCIINVSLSEGVDDAMAEAPIFESPIVAEPTGQNWVYTTNKIEGVVVDKAGLYTLDVKNTSSIDVYMLYALVGMGDNYGNWAEQNPAGDDAVETIAADNTENVRAYNLQGIEVSRDTKGLIILSNGTKVLNK